MTAQVDALRVAAVAADARPAWQAVGEDILVAADQELRRRRRARAPERLSMSTMRRGEACELSMYLGRIIGDPGGAPAIAGRAFHEFAAAARFRARMRGEREITPDSAHALATAVLERIDEPIRGPERDLVLGWARSWATWTTFPGDEADYVGIEELWTHDLDFHTLSARLDHVVVIGDTVEIDDEKTGQPPRWRGYIYEAFQPKNYAWHAAQRFPDAWLFVVTERYTRTGQPYTVAYSRADVEEVIDPWLRALAVRLGRAWGSGKFTAQPGSWCARCPDPHSCTYPEAARPASGDMTPAALQARASALHVTEARAKREREALRTIVDLLGLDAIPAGDKQLGYVEKTKRVVPGKRDAERLGLTDEREAALAAIEAIKIDRPAPEFGWSPREDA